MVVVFMVSMISVISVKQNWAAREIHWKICLRIYDYNARNDDLIPLKALWISDLLRFLIKYDIFANFIIFSNQNNNKVGVEKLAEIP